MSPLSAVLVLVGTMAVAVVATMVVENWHHLVRRVPVGRGAVGTDAPVDAPVDAAAHAADEPPAPGPDPVPAAGLPDGALRTGPGVVEVRDVETARVLAALLFAAFATRRTSGSDRASAWVTAAATPPGADPGRFPAGVDLRGRPGRVEELLDHHEGGAAWVTVQPAVDIARGVSRTPVRQAVLAGLVTWWDRSCRRPAGAIAPDDVASVRDAVAAVRPRLVTTPWAGAVAALHAALHTATAAGTALRVDVGPWDTAGADAAAPAEGRDRSGTPGG